MRIEAKKRLIPLNAPLGEIVGPNRHQESALQPYGVGITLYFKYLVMRIFYF